jgi:hypothetical protein
MKDFFLNLWRWPFIGIGIFCLFTLCLCVLILHGWDEMVDRFNANV